MSSPFALSLGTNYCPTDDEVVQIRSLLVQPTLRLKTLDDEIGDLQKAIDKLVEERDSLGTYVGAHRALLSPARRLPLDILQEIFIACMPTQRNCVMSAIEAPVLLGRICSAWRTVSLSTPRLWARVHIVEPQPQGWGSPTAEPKLSQKVAQRLEITKIWLGRSGELPLSISMQSCSNQFLEGLIPFAARWQHIHFTTPPPSLFEVISYLDTDMPWLETVEFHVSQYYGSENIACGSFSILRGLRISSFSVSGNIFVAERFPLVWNQLTSLTIGGPSGSTTSEMTLDVISKCPGLRCCKLMIMDASPEVTVSQHPTIALPFLHTLAIHCVTYVAPTVLVFLKHLSVPELRNFTLLGFLKQDYPTLAELFASSIHLESLDVVLFSKSSLFETLRSLPPTIQRLTIRGIETSIFEHLPDDDTLELLATPGILPALQELYIHWGLCISEAAVVRFITMKIRDSRPDDETTLGRVEIHFHREMTFDIMPSLQPLLETAGLTVSLRYLLPVPVQSSPWQGLAEDISRYIPPGLPTEMW
ncbi:hypothetical protein K438DRAFT_1845880 [Mycena galopus ATCC 62051]|nr:hypothetical protein K438DRAFT_1845880 [Mycena galopus ATCC 62051]